MKFAISLGLVFATLATLRADDAVPRVLEYAPAAVANPLKGLVPYAGVDKNAFPHTLEFSYLPLSKLLVGPDRYDWQPLEKLLNAIAARGHQVVFRVYVEYPGKTDGIPAHLRAAGLKVNEYQNTHEKPTTKNLTPDYADPALRTALTRFIAALGAKYDGDARIGFLTAGLLGYWGEWHTYPREDLAPSKAVEIEVMDAYEAAFKITPVLLRYPAGAKNADHAANATRRFGYHDDSFAWATLDTGRRNDAWFYMAALKAAGPDALDKWKTQPIGGEIRPEAWGQVFDPKPQRKEIQDFRRCVEETHATWLMDSGMFERKATPERLERAKLAVQQMGYEFHAKTVQLRTKPGQLTIRLEIENRGVAPFYAKWPATYALASGTTIAHTAKSTDHLQGLLPGAEPRVWAPTLTLPKLAAGNYQVLVSVPNPLAGANPVRFANRTQDADLPGFLSLGEITLP